MKELMIESTQQWLSLAQPHQLIMIFVAVAAVVIVMGLIARARYRRPSQRWRIKASKRLLKRLSRMDSSASIIHYLRQVDPYTFEEAILSAFEQHGYRVRRGDRYSGDGGVDGQVKIGSQWWLIQSKRYKSHIKPDHVTRFKALCEKKKRRGFFVHTGKTGPSAQQIFNQSERIYCISGDRLIDLMHHPDKSNQSLASRYATTLFFS